MILVVGATGILGSAICRAARTRGLPVRGLVRSGSAKAAALREIGVEISAGDLRSDKDVDAACRGVSAVISTATAMGTKDKSLTMRAIDRDGQLRLVEAAKRTGVSTFVFVSLPTHLRETAPLVRYKRIVESAVRSSGMQWTILQPSIFMDVWLSPTLGWDFVKGKATIAGSGREPLAWIAVDDVASYALQSLDDPRLANQHVPLGGPEMLSPNRVLEIVETMAKRRYRVTRIPRTLLAVLSRVFGPFNDMAASGTSLFAQAALGDGDFETTLQRGVGLPLTSVEQYARRVLNA